MRVIDCSAPAEPQRWALGGGQATAPSVIPSGRPRPQLLAGVVEALGLLELESLDVDVDVDVDDSLVLVDDVSFLEPDPADP